MYVGTRMSEIVSVASEVQCKFAVVVVCSFMWCSI